MKKRVYFELSRETKGTYMYSEVDADGKPVEADKTNVPSLYIKKAMFKKMKGAPENLSILVVVEED